MAFRKKKQDPFHEIQVCLQKRDYKGALDWFNTLLQKDSKNTQIRLRFADTLVLSGKKREAVKQFRIVADELAEKGFMIRAIAINKKILQLDPGQTDVHDKLAEMSEARTGERPTRPALEELLHRPNDPLRRPEPPAVGPSRAAEPVRSTAPPPTRPPSTPEILPELSLEESMAMEFGAGGEIPGEAEARQAPPVEDPAPAEPYTGGFELVDEEQDVPAAEAPTRPQETDGLGDETPTFAEEPVDLSPSTPTEAQADEEEEVEIVTIDADDSEPAIELSLDGVEAPVDASAEIVLEADVDAESPREEVEVIGLGDGGSPEEEAEGAEEAEMEVIAFDGESEPELAAEGVESLIGALGEDIDSLIDSIIDDVGSSAKGAEPSKEPPPTHIPLFSDLTTQEFIAVAILLVRRVAKVGEVIVREGDPGDSMFIVSTGEVRATVLRNGQQLPVATMRDGDFFGEMAVLSGEPRTATVTAVKATELLELSRENLREICSRHPHVEAKIRLAYDERMARSAARRS